jgi:hypothetical protein
MKELKIHMGAPTSWVVWDVPRTLCGIKIKPKHTLCVEDILSNRSKVTCEDCKRLIKLSWGNF